MDEGFGKKIADGPEPLFSFFGDDNDMREILGMEGDDAAWAASWQASSFYVPPDSIIPEAEKEETNEEWETRMWARMAKLNEVDEDEDSSDYEANRARDFRRDWEFQWSNYGAFEDTTRIPPMQFTFSKPPDRLYTMRANALQIFSAEVTETRCSFPFNVFGMVAMRDTVDYNRNIVFSRTRDNCQTLTEENPCLILTGPTRAVVVEPSAPVFIEVDLTVKGSTDSEEDEKLSFLAVPILSSSTRFSLWKCAYTSKLSTVEFTLGHIVSSVEATIFVQVTRGSWPDGFRGQFSAIATGDFAKIPCTAYQTSVNDEEIVLLDSRGERLPISDDGNVELSWRVVSVDTSGELKICVKAWPWEVIKML